MRTITPILLISATVLVGCGFSESRVNPLNWFGRAQPETTTASQEAATPAEPEVVNPLIPQRRNGLFAQARERRDTYFGTPIEQVTGLVIERVPGGALVRATGLAQSSAVFDVQLTPEDEDLKPTDGVLTYRLEGITPTDPNANTSNLSRTVTAATRLTDQELRGVRTIRVESRTNALVSRR